MIKKIYMYIGAAIAFIGGLISLYLSGKKAGEAKEKTKAMETIIDSANQAKEEINAVDILSADESREQLREFTKN